MSSIDAPCEALNDYLVPRMFKAAYEKEWDKFHQFLEEQKVDEIEASSSLAFLSSQSKKNYAPTTIRRSTSNLKICV